ncbi:hypothetical protein [Aeoliella sp. SH292]|uniref:hypothetical protein n=1 Tax=Aeoliella sp. SH292 TaxID=3454464 RepID=UPI003F9BFB31
MAIGIKMRAQAELDGLHGKRNYSLLLRVLVAAGQVKPVVDRIGSACVARDRASLPFYF